MKYLFITLDENYKTKVVCEVTVGQKGELTFDPPEKEENIVRLLTSNPFDDDKNQREAPIDIHDPEDWKRVPDAIHGSHFWCQSYEEATDEKNVPSAES